MYSLSFSLLFGEFSGIPFFCYITLSSIFLWIKNTL